MTAAICYAATSGFLFQTTLSAIQARGTTPGVDVFVVHVAGPSEGAEEAAVFRRVLERRGVTVLTLDGRSLGGLPPIFARYHLDEVLPDRVDRVLYLDGDTQVRGDLSPLLTADPGDQGLAAAVDPMVVLSELDPRMAVRIGRWWDRSEIPRTRRERYLNSGVLLLDRRVLPTLQERVTTHAASHPRLVFPDQDALNATVPGGVGRFSLRWNFPGFLLGTAAEPVVGPRVVHFMSRPRPWNASLPPWGEKYHAPYRDLVRGEPQLSKYWQRFGVVTRARYRAQHAFKAVTERRAWRGSDAEVVVRRIESEASVGTEKEAP